MKQLALVNPEQATDAEVSRYQIREATRAVVVDDKNNLGLLHVAAKSYYKIPGGGIEPGEDKETALRRECLEEVGCEIEILQELGQVIEYRKMFGKQQISYCYLAKVVGDKGQTAFTESELADSFGVLWVPYDEALRLVQSVVTDDQEGKLYITPRLEFILKAASQYFS